MENNETPRRVVTFAAIDPYIERNIIPPTERSYSGQERVTWGPGDKYPGYIIDLYDTTPTLHSIIDGCVDFIAGDDCLFDGDPRTTLNPKGENARKIVRRLGLSRERLGGFAIEVIRAKDGKPLHVYALDASTIRSNKDNTLFWYSEKWGKAGAEAKMLPAFMPITPEQWAQMDEKAREFHAVSIYYVKDDPLRVYPVPCFASAVKDAESERGIADYHLNSLDNGFAASAIINMNNGIPQEKDAEEIEKDLNEKFSGHSNAGRIMVSFNPSKDQQATITTLRTEDFGEKYAALSKHSRQQLFTAFRASPVLFGIPTDNNGFAADNYTDAFKLFNRTHVRPIQTEITDAFEAIFGFSVLTIVPFTLDGNGEANVK